MLQRVLQKLQGPRGGIWSVKFTPGGSYTALAAWDGSIHIHEVATGKQVRSIAAHTEEVIDVIFLGSGEQLVSTSSDTNCRIWDVAYSPGGNWLATSSSDQTVRLWDSESGNLVLSIPAFAGTFARLRFDTNGRRLLAVSGLHSLNRGIVQQFNALGATQMDQGASHQGVVSENVNVPVNND